MSLALKEQDLRIIGDLLSEVSARFSSAEDADFLAQATVLAHQLPRDLRLALNDFRLQEPGAAICRISGYPIDDRKIGPTPAHWKERQRRCIPVREEFLLVLIASLLGEVIAWSTQQDGAVVHDIAPVKNHEREQLGSGSAEELTWHTEDAFHTYRGDYIGMMCLRNPDRVPTTFAALDISELDAATVDLLFQPLYTIRPDESHLRKNRVDLPSDQQQLEAAHDRIDQMNQQPDKIAVLFGSREEPYCRLDPYFMDSPEEPEAREALDRLIRLVDSQLEDLILAPGELCFIDNFKAVHGRRPFKARFDGTDRWLKRVNITRDLRRSRSSRPSAESRLLL
ncbi:MAG TPA: guanitoxin biosynthesis L-enduracididine beta-hydroxylase GntD [Thermoanaerobaculia bacterium]|nr:guanitoxin biosynthesis L-enduracididine beta-hydroxylase GntD [Thermoanaerobaculia bacterium]